MTEAIQAPDTTPEGEELAEFVTLTDEAGKDFEFEILDTLEVDGKEYALLAPKDAIEGDDNDEVLILRVESDDTFSSVTDDAEFQRVVEAIQAMVEEAPVAEPPATETPEA